MFPVVLQQLITGWTFRRYACVSLSAKLNDGATG